MSNSSTGNLLPGHTLGQEEKYSPLTSNKVSITYDNARKAEKSSVIPNEPFTSNDLTNLYNSMSNTPSTASKYDMNDRVQLPKTHPDYTPEFNDMVMYDITDKVTHEYNTMMITVTATISLGIIAYMVSTTKSE
jgi:hypothetical protein